MLPLESPSFFHFPLYSSGENVLALCITLKIGCLSPGSARNGKHFSPFFFSFLDYFHTEERMLTYAMMYTAEVHFCHFKLFFLLKKLNPYTLQRTWILRSVKKKIKTTITVKILVYFFLILFPCLHFFSFL